MKATSILILLCFLATFVAWFLEPSFVERNLLFSLENVEQGRVWTAVTALFVHANLVHLLGNMLFLYVFGGTVEGVRGARGMLGAFLFGGVLSFLLSVPFFPPDSTFAGASAAIFTLTAIAMLVKPLKFSWLLLMPVGVVAVFFFIFNALAVAYQYQGNVAYVSHIIGFLLGTPIGMAWSTQWRRNVAISIGLLALYAALIYLILNYVVPALR